MADTCNFQEEFNFIQQNLESWREVSLDEIDLYRFPMGMSRAVYRVSLKHKDIQPKSIILRELTSPTDVHKVDTEKEAYMFKLLSDCGFGPALIAESPQYRIEEFFDSKMITSAEMRDKYIRRMFGIKLGSLHKIKPGVLAKSSYTINKLNDHEMIQKCRDNCNLDIFSEENMKIINILKQVFSEEHLDSIKKMIPNDDEDLVLSHNDVWAANILMGKSKSTVKLIDYETMTYNFAGYDIGALFIGTMYCFDTFESGFDFDFKEENYPTDEEIMDFLRFYLVRRKLDLTLDEEDEILTNEETLARLEKKAYPNEVDYQQLKKKMFHHIRIGTMAMAYSTVTVGIRLTGLPNFSTYFMKLIKCQLSTYQKYKKAALEGN